MQVTRGLESNTSPSYDLQLCYAVIGHAFRDSYEYLYISTSARDPHRLFTIWSAYACDSTESKPEGATSYVCVSQRLRSRVTRQLDGSISGYRL